jgi:beta-phosphoglucomutase-like phosphatase (HAD superfamily)
MPTNVALWLQHSSQFDCSCVLVDPVNVWSRAAKREARKAARKEEEQSEASRAEEEADDAEAAAEEARDRAEREREQRRREEMEREANAQRFEEVDPDEVRVGYIFSGSQMCITLFPVLH